MSNNFNEMKDALYDIVNEIPTEVLNAIEDVFDENDEIADVEIFLKDDINILEEELLFKNEVFVSLDNPSIGKVYNSYTYYGDCKPSASYNVVLAAGENAEDLIENLIDAPSIDNIGSFDSSDWLVILIEEIDFNNKKVNYINHLKVYIPVKEGDTDNE